MSSVLHLIPDDGQPHAPTSECGCGPVLVTVDEGNGVFRPALWHPSPDESPPESPIRLDADALSALDQGGLLPAGCSTVFNGTGQPEPVLTRQQWTAID